MPVLLRDVLGYLDTTLEIGRFRDYAPNGLQVEGAPVATTEVTTIVTGVSASAALIERAIDERAQLLVVHHGLVWGPGLATITGPLAHRLRQLLSHGITLAGYHLPLDAHAQLGNNAGLADALGLGAERSWFGDVRGIPLGLAGAWAVPIARDLALARIAAAVGASAPRFAFPYGPAQVRRVGLCTGAASDLLEAAAGAGCDLFVTGELAERAGDLAAELGITLVAAGHYATEVFGPQRLAAELTARFPGVRATFVPVPSPL